MPYGLDPEIYEERYEFSRNYYEREDRTMLITYIKKNRNGDYSKTGRVIREPERMKKGVMVAVPVSEDKVRLGWALCAFTKGDEYDPEMAMKIAVGRAESGSTDRPADSMLKPLRKFQIRATKYYKDKKVERTFPLTGMHKKDLSEDCLHPPLEV